MAKSWRTTTAGILGVLAVLFHALQALLDGNPATVPQWEVVIPLIVTQLGLVFARDHAAPAAPVTGPVPAQLMGNADRPANPAAPTTPAA